MTDELEEKATKLVEAVRGTMLALEAIPIKAIATAFREQGSEFVITDDIANKQKLAGTLREIANELESNISRLDHAVVTAKENIELLKAATRVVNNPEFSKANKSLGEFIGLLERLQRLRDSGLLTDIVNLSRQ